MIEATRALVVLSGGQDSTTCLAQAIQKYGVDNIHAVTFDYGQRHKVEIKAALEIAARAGISTRHMVVTSLAGTLVSASPLVDHSIKVAIYPSAEALPGGLEKTFVPMRNQFFLTLAANRAVAIGLHHQCDVDIITGVSEEDYGGYPDCRDKFISNLNRAINAALDDEDLPYIRIHTPLMYLTKAETVHLSESIPGARALLAWSHTCYNGAVPPCGQCHACLLRAKGYRLAGVEDPLLERLFNSFIGGSIPPVK